MKKIINKEIIKFKYYQSLIGKTIRIRLSEINVLKETDKIFIKHQETVDSIKASMEKIGFDKSCPIKCFINNDDGKLYVYEGHTRYLCASELSLEYVWIYIDGKISKEEAINKTISEQLSRRNIDDADLVHCFIQLKEQGLSVSMISEHLQKSKRQLYKVQELLAKCNKEEIEALSSGKVGINELYQRIKNFERQQDLKDETEKQSQVKRENEEIENFIEINEEDVIQKVENGEKENIQKRKRKLDEKENEIIKRENHLNQQPGNKDVLLIGIQFGIIEMLKGASPDSIINNPILLQLSDFNSLIKPEDYTFLFAHLKEDVNGSKKNVL